MIRKILVVFVLCMVRMAFTDEETTEEPTEAPTAVKVDYGGLKLSYSITDYRYFWLSRKISSSEVEKAIANAFDTSHNETGVTFFYTPENPSFRSKTYARHPAFQPNIEIKFDVIDGRGNETAYFDLELKNEEMISNVFKYVVYHIDIDDIVTLEDLEWIMEDLVEFHLTRKQEDFYSTSIKDWKPAPEKPFVGVTKFSNLKFEVPERSFWDMQTKWQYPRGCGPGIGCGK